MLYLSTQNVILGQFEDNFYIYLKTIFYVQKRKWGENIKNVHFIVHFFHVHFGNLTVPWTKWTVPPPYLTIVLILKSEGGHNSWKG